MDRARANENRLRRKAGRFLRREARGGATAIEFAVIAPVLVLFLVGLIETGIIYYFNSTLANAATDAARLLRTGQVQGTGMTKTQYVAQICSEMTAMVTSTNCNANLQVDMEAFSSYTNAQYADVVNTDGSLNTAAMQFNPGNACDTVLVRAFYPWSIITPLMKGMLQNMPNGQFLMTSAAAFRNEPYAAGATC